MKIVLKDGTEYPVDNDFSTVEVLPMTLYDIDSVAEIFKAFTDENLSEFQILISDTISNSYTNYICKGVDSTKANNTNSLCTSFYLEPKEDSSYDKIIQVPDEYSEAAKILLGVTDEHN